MTKFAEARPYSDDPDAAGAFARMMSHRGRPPCGEARNFDQAKKLFREAFEKWQDSSRRA